MRISSMSDWIFAAAFLILLAIVILIVGAM
nr:MAG TPA: hypothetical protein [Caudoviricetes sp.]